MMSAVTPLAPQRAARIATQLVELIDLQKLSPGDRLPPERQLADLLEVSRPSLREALHILQAQGLVQIKHGQGTFVQEPIVAQELRASMMATTHGLNELFDARQVLEVPASKWAAEKAKHYVAVIIDNTCLPAPLLSMNLLDKLPDQNS